MRPSYNYRQATSFPDFMYNLASLLLVEAYPPWFFIETYKPKQMMRDTLLLFESSLIGNYWQTFVHLHCVAIDDFAIESSSQVYGKLRTISRRIEENL